MKICNTFIYTNLLQFPSTPIKILKLFPIDKDETVSDFSRTLYQQKIGSLLFDAIATRPNIAFAISRIFIFNQQLGYQHCKVADQVFHYLFLIQEIYIRYKRDIQDLSLFVYTNNVFINDNTLDWKSFQGYIIKLFGRAILWKANKQNIVTTLFIKTELLAISQIIKKAIYLFCLIKALQLFLPEVLTIKNNNKQIIRFFVDKSTKL